MKAALLTEVNKPLEIHDLEAAELQFGQVLVRVSVSGICGAQLQEIRGEKGSHFPRLIGHEGCGIVEQVGPGVKTVKAGDKVVMHWRKGDGIESDSPRYTLHGREITGGQVVTFATHAICSENRLTAIPEDAPDDLCALLGCGLSTAFGTIEQEANLKMGERIMIMGCGGLGLNLVAAAKMRRASYIRATDIVPDKVFAARRAGASEPREDWMTPYDVVIDTSGSEQAFMTGLDLLAPSGRFIMVGQPTGAVTIANGRAMFDGDGKSIKATQGGGFQPHRDIPRYYQLWKSGQLDLDGIVSHRISLDQINDGIALVSDGHAGRVLIEI